VGTVTTTEPYRVIANAFAVSRLHCRVFLQIAAYALWFSESVVPLSKSTARGAGQIPTAWALYTGA